MDEPQTPETPTPAPTPLGQDPQPTSPPAQPQAPQAAAEPVIEEPQLSASEIQALQQKATNFDMISQDPELSSYVLDHFRAKTGRVRPRPQEPQQPQQPQVPQQNQIDPATQRLIDKQARQEVELFKLKNPDMESVQQDMAKLLNQYPTMSLDDAYRFSKLQATSQSQQNPVQKSVPATPTTETNKSAGIQEPSLETDFSDIERRINDPKATPHMDDAIMLAFQAAKQQTGG